MKSVISFAGGGVLVWMGVAMLRSARAATLAADPNGPRGMGPVVAGIVASISNPYWTLWWATSGFALLVTAMAAGLLGVAVFFVGHILADLVWYSVVSTAVSKGRRIMSDGFYRGLIAICAVTIIGYALWFIRSGWRFIADR